jgi:hypothetical protein
LIVKLTICSVPEFWRTRSDNLVALMPDIGKAMDFFATNCVTMFLRYSQRPVPAALLHL